ncbi:MAG: glycoside hydrolase family 5 protein [Lachnospiraceae bacterium]|nr:glycoside hydrolase family 5 protein [Lachnospiraceae bacterium]
MDDPDEETAKTPGQSGSKGFRVGGQVPDSFKDYGKQEDDDHMERSLTISDKPFLKAAGKVLRDDYGNGALVQLKGTNVGGYLLQEFWMTVGEYTENVTAQEDVFRVLTDRFGREKALELINLYQENFFTETDFDYCRDLGMNCLRLPFWYRNIVDENGEFYEDCWDLFDNFVENAGKRGLYVILDFHGAPGSQNGSDHSGKDGHDEKQTASEFFFGDEEVIKANHELYYRIWEAVAEHFNGNPWVAGYDLLNEPYCTYRYNTGLPDALLHRMLWDIYDEAYRRIRALDPDHLIIMEATWNASDLPGPDLYGWENVMYQYHTYLYDDYDNSKGQQIANVRSRINNTFGAGYNVPSLLGEFSLFNSLDAWDEGVRLVNDSGFSWTTWTYKTIASVGNWGLKHTRDYHINLEKADLEQIENAWTKIGEATDNTGLARILSKYYKQEFTEVTR